MGKGPVGGRENKLEGGKRGREEQKRQRLRRTNIQSGDALKQSVFLNTEEMYNILNHSEAKTQRSTRSPLCSLAGPVVQDYKSCQPAEAAHGNMDTSTFGGITSFAKCIAWVAVPSALFKPDRVPHDLYTLQGLSRYWNVLSAQFKRD